ncbi:restriction endonuclease subunit S [Salmonella enterica]|nr:restriction endonuclease subunit S [Salmonella enterica]EBB6985312.1 restriction endonuclease subunit S [Salmonella enterica]EBB9331681.1 restriction endonuclease subunit S [Salmonella enterica]EBC0975740.1 restriction endonuclease subunit S [Salmonella enterica]EBC2146142.1 restriction endonuclease subunit S [Salmonella enterica]EBJ4782653.1 restriction endonuclease subunit S [Salmonella enterica]
MAVEKLIVDHIDTWTTARQTRSTAGRGSSGKIDLYGIKKLRELILELAVRGKLVPQDSNDEPASVLLKRIAAEKAELVKQGKIKKSKPLPEISEDDEPFDLPKGWEWVRFGDICEIERGGSPRPIKDYLTSEKDGLNWIKIGDTDIGGKYITSAEEKIKPSGLHKTRMVYPGDFLLTNSMSFGRPYITLIEGCIHDGWLRISPPSSLDNDFLYQLLSSPFIAKAFKEKASGAVVLNLNADKVRETFILVPPFSEQQRIVTKANELMSLCDQLEQHTLTSLDAHQQLVETLLTTLTNSQNADELAENWARISEHFDTLFTTEASIDTLKQTILQLAVMGKLVPQDPNDEPASELLKRIAQEKAQLVKDGKMKKQKPLPPISDEEKPFVTPNHWEWVRFGEIGEIKGGGTPSKNNSAFWEGDIPWVSPKDMKVDYISKSELSISQDAVQNSSVTLISEESLLFVVRGMILAHTFPVAIAKKEVTINQDMKAISTDLYHPDFLIKMMKACSIRVLSLVDRSSHGTCKLVSDKLFSLVLPLPPLKEQLRISSEVDSFINNCENLKQIIKETQQTQLHLADALTDAAIN